MLASAVITHAVMTSPIGVEAGTRPWCSTRLITSRSERTPASLVPSITITMPTLFSAIRCTASDTIAVFWTMKRNPDRMMSRRVFIVEPPSLAGLGAAGDRGRQRGRRLLGNAGQLAQEQAGPAVDVVLSHRLAHPGHPGALLLGRHLDRAADRVGHAVEVVGVDEQRVAELRGSARELAQDERAPVLADRDELLGDEVHAVVERRDQAQVGMAVVRPDLAVVVVALDIVHGPPLPGAEARVDVADRGVHFRVDLLVARDARAARRRKLDDDEPLPVLGTALEEAPDGADALRQALGVVEALDANAQELARDPEPAQESLAGDARRVGHEFWRHADRKRLDQGRALPARDGELLPLDPRLEGPLGRLEEVVAVVLGVEAHQVGPEHAEQELLLPRADAEGLRVRPRDMPEN